MDLNLFPACSLKNLLRSLDPVIMGCPGDPVITRGSRFAAPLISAGRPSSESRCPGDENGGEQSLSNYPLSSAEAGLTRLGSYCFQRVRGDRKGSLAGRSALGQVSYWLHFTLWGGL